MDQWTGGFHVNSSWIEAVTLIVVRKKTKKKENEKKSPPNSTYYDYEVATIEREGIPFVSAEDGVLERQKTATNRRRHLPSANLQEADFAVEWRPIIGHSMVDQFEKNFEKNSQIISPNVPQLFTSESITWSSARSKCSPASGLHLLPPQLALRICALRCLFVELGILLVTTSNNKSADEPVINSEIDQWRLKVAEDPSAFLQLFQQNSTLRPKLSETESLLFEWWNWLTPTTVGRSPRYDTLFYLVVLEGNTHSTAITTLSSDRISWNSPDDLFSQYSRHQFLLSPTQLYELLRVSSHPWADWLHTFARQREANGIQRWIPLVALYSNGTISYLPGDQYYPPKVDLLPSKTPRMYSGLSTETMRAKTLNSTENRRMNRIEHSGYWCKVVVTLDEVVAGNDVLTETKNADVGGHLSIFYHELPVNRISANSGDGGSANGAAVMNAKL